MPTTFFGWVGYLLEEYGPLFLRGAGMTMLIAISGTILGFLIGLLVGIARTIELGPRAPMWKRALVRLLNAVLGIYIEVFRGTPMMVQAMFLYYGLQPIIGWDGPTAGLFVISINTGAYMAEIIRSGLQSVDSGQSEAAKSLGMSTLQTMVHIIFPQAIRNAFPSIGNQLIVNIKDSSMLSVIWVLDLFFQSQSLAGSNYRPVETYFVATVLYLILTTIATLLLNFVEKRMNMKSETRDLCA